MKRLGPELKMPKLGGSERKVPPFLSDLYIDLRDRRLLPLVILILVAIVAAPILLGGPEEPEPAPAPGPVAGGSASTSASSLTVVQAQPGLRDYKKRLAHRSATNPFDQRYDGPQLKGAQLNEPTSATSATTTTVESGSAETPVTSPASGGSSESTTGSPGAGSGGGNGGGDPVPADGLTYYTFAIDLQIVRAETTSDGKTEKTEPTVRKEVRPPEALPGEKAQVVTYMGTSSKTHKPLFLISPKVQSVFGEGKCVAGEESCQLVELEPGLPEVFVYGENQVRYKITVLEVEPVVTGHS